MVAVALYLFWWLTTPYNSTKLQFLFEIKFERILAAVLLVLVLIQGKNPKCSSSTCPTRTSSVFPDVFELPGVRFCRQQHLFKLV